MVCGGRLKFRSSTRNCIGARLTLLVWDAVDMFGSLRMEEQILSRGAKNSENKHYPITVFLREFCSTNFPPLLGSEAK